MSNQILLDLKDQLISPKEAYKELYSSKSKRKLRKAHFVKIKVRVPDDKAANRILRIFLLFPFPLFLIRIALRFVKDDSDSLPLSKNEIYELISYRGINVNVKSKNGELVIIKTI